MKFDELIENPDVPAAGRRGRSFELRKQPPLLAGALPTVSLLPRELKAAAYGRSVRRLLVIGVVAALVVAGGTTAGAGALAGAAQARLDAANAQTRELMTQTAKFRDVQALQQGIAFGRAGVEVGTSTEIDWQAQIQSIEAEMPAGFTVTSIQADSATPILDYEQGTTPLDQPRAASMTLTATTSDITKLPPWLRSLRSIGSYADATAAVTSDPEAGYTVQLVIHLSKQALVANAKGTK